jgi:hypothetical protein
MISAWLGDKHIDRDKRWLPKHTFSHLNHKDMLENIKKVHGKYHEGWYIQ